jgi:hypothetical protein
MTFSSLSNPYEVRTVPDIAESGNPFRDGGEDEDKTIGKEGTPGGRRDGMSVRIYDR